MNNSYAPLRVEGAKTLINPAMSSEDVELAIRDLEGGSGLEHCPSGDFNASGAWAVLTSIAHHLLRWVAALGLEITGPFVAKTIRRKFITLPGSITTSARCRYLQLPSRWPWAAQYASRVW
jgi:hypothetical protein